jgi:hypothetical protein
MIDNPKQTVRLLTKLLAHLPIEARPSTLLADYLREEFPEHRFPERYVITDIQYGGNEAGILCQVDTGRGEDPLLYASLTHLEFDRRTPLAREIFAYQKHRRSACVSPILFASTSGRAC